MKVFIADYIGIIYLEEKFLKKGHTVYLNVNRSFNHKLRDISDLNIKYPNQLIFVEDKEMLDEVVPMVDFGIQYNCGNPSIIDRVFKKHNKVLVHSKTFAPFILEKDRIFAKRLDLGFDRYDVRYVASYMEFKEIPKKKRYVLKAYNENSSKINDNFRTVITKNNDELGEILKLDTYGHIKSGGAVLEEYIDGVEICCGFYWDSEKIVANTVFINQEYKCVLDNNRSGVLGGESGTVIVPIEVKDLPKRFKIAVQKLSEYLKENFPNFHGFIDMNTMIKGNKLYLLEFTVRVGVPTEYEIARIIGDYAGFIECVATGKEFTHKIKKGFYTFVCLYPYGYPYSYGRFIFVSMKNPIPKNMIPIFYKYEGNKMYYYECGRCLAFVGFGNTMEDSIKDCYTSLYKWDDNHLIYRNDIGKDFMKAWTSLNNLE